ncbi:MAG: iron-containing alcohol dehydrogenase, partial [Schwartzia sp.]|nr:iron-containing alcohol dehydrogenase [Schwartzia sp. (in: firmicutes)]
FAQYAEAVWGATVGTVEEKARAGIRETEEFWRGLGLPLYFTELGVGELDEDALAALADSCTDGGKKTVGEFRPLDKETALAIYRRANR